MKKKFFFACLFFFANKIIAQNIGIGTTTPNPSAILDVVATNKGLLVPRVSLTDVNDNVTIPTPSASLLIYNTATSGTAPLNVLPGFYYWNSTAWIPFVTSDNSLVSAWLLGGNLGTSAKVNYVGTSDNQPLALKVNNKNAGFLGTTGNTFLGLNSGNVLNTGVSNVAVGNAALSKITNQSNLVAIGDSALLNNGLGATQIFESTGNTAVGSKTLFANTKGYFNTALGARALFAVTTGSYNP